MSEHIVRCLTTIRDLLRFAVSEFNKHQLFFGHGTTNAHDEAAYLILHTLHLPLDTLEPFLDAHVLPEEQSAVLDIIEKRVTQKIPAAYLTHEAWQGDFSFYVDQRVIVPRSFIYEVLGEPLRPWIEYDELIHRALDLCTGSGALAIQMAEHYPAAEIDAVDLSQDALDVAAINVHDYGLKRRIHLIKSDMFQNLSGNYDLIISNPPYVDADAVAHLPDEYKHEPSMSLGSGMDGLDATRIILKHAADYLNPKGVLVVEIGHNRLILEHAFPHLPFTWLQTQSGDDFIFLLTREDLIASCNSDTDN